MKPKSTSPCILVVLCNSGSSFITYTKQSKGHPLRSDPPSIEFHNDYFFVFWRWIWALFPGLANGEFFLTFINIEHTEIFTLTLQKPRVLQMQGVPFDKLRGEAVVVYADLLTGLLPLASTFG
jgi:hypothetical protein